LGCYEQKVKQADLTTLQLKAMGLNPEDDEGLYFILFVPLPSTLALTLIFIFHCQSFICLKSFTGPKVGLS
jgi:hypothetical protein